MTRATMTLIGVAAAGLLIWIASRVDLDAGPLSDRAGRYWAAMGLLAAAGLTMALCQLLGGWTKWGWPRISLAVLLIGFLPALVAGGWVLAATAPSVGWVTRHVRNWSGDIGIDGLVRDLGGFSPAIAFGIGLVFGFALDTSGPRTAVVEERGAAVAVPARDQSAASQPERETVVTRPTDTADASPPPEPSPRAGEPE